MSSVNILSITQILTSMAVFFFFQHWDAFRSALKALFVVMELRSDCICVPAGLVLAFYRNMGGWRGVTADLLSILRLHL